MSAAATSTPTPCGGSCFIQSSDATITPGVELVAGSQCDDCAAPIALPFGVTIGTQTYTTAYAVSNGHLDFTKPYIDFDTSCIPTDTVDTAIFGFWTDLTMVSSDCGVIFGI